MIRPITSFFKDYSCSCIFAISVLLCQCAPVLVSEARVDFLQPGFDGSQMSAGIIILPLQTSHGCDTAALISPRRQAQWIKEKKFPITVIPLDTFTRRYYAFYDTASLDSFYNSLFKSDMLKIQGADSAWKTMDAIGARFALIWRMPYAARIKSFEGITLLTMNIEAEIWDSHAQAVVWRSMASVTDRNSGIKDGEFVFDTMKKILGLLTFSTKPTITEEHW